MKNYQLFYVLSLITLSFFMVSCYESDDVPEEEMVDPSEFTQKLLIEDYTGTWCVNCPKAGYYIEKAVEDNNRFIPIGVHFYAVSDPEEMQNTFTEQLVAHFNISSFPKVSLNRFEHVWAGEYAITDLDRLLNRYAPVGLAINSSLVGNTVNTTVKVGFVEEITTVDNYKLVVFLLEDGLIYSQLNGFPLVGGEHIDDYEHNNVLRHSFTNVLGDNIPNEVALDHRLSKDFSTTLPSYIEDASKLKIVAFVVDKNGYCLNAQVALIGENKDFD